MMTPVAPVMEVNTMQTANVKTVAHQLIDQLPEDATWEALMYALQVRQDIELGRADGKAGRVKTTEELRKSLGLQH